MEIERSQTHVRSQEEEEEEVGEERKQEGAESV